MTWLVRSQNLVIAYTAAASLDSFDCSSEVDEMAILVPRGSAVLSSRALENSVDTTSELPAGSFTVVPAGTATVTMARAGILVRIFSVRSTELSAACLNAAAYADHDPNIPPFQAWSATCLNSAPTVFDSAAVKTDPGRFGRIYRSDATMVNIFYPQVGPRDPSAMSPHWHDDFDQVSLQLEGDYIHHVRTTWGADLNDWRADVHRRCVGPALAIFPPPLVHTSQAMSAGTNQLIDIFGPPRRDFAEQPGWLLNAEGVPND
ncbi:MAG: hypothetical protein JWN80_3049 [Microbacteriaceae bacterium]|nr:hypothetical protein [Microbacteriaceae bacterium]